MRPYVVVVVVAAIAAIALVLVVEDVAARCTVARHETGFGDRIQCSNASLSDVESVRSSVVSAIMIFGSRIPSIPGDAFARHGKSLESLNINDCGIAAVSYNAFSGLAYLKKLGLPNNRLTELRPEWFDGLLSLEQLDLSFNRIRRIDPAVFPKIARLRRFDVGENELSCLEPDGLRSLASLERIGFQGNPLNLKCRGELTLWLRDHGVNYKSDPHGPESWLDPILWLCAVYNEGATEIATRECLLLNLFEEIPPGESRQCTDRRNALLGCVADGGSRPTNGNVLARLLVLLRTAAATSP